MNDEQINEVMRLADEIADYAWKQGVSDGAYSQADHDRKSCDASRAALEAYLRTIGEPENTFPLNPNGASKWANLQKHDGAEAIGVVFRTGSGSVGSLVDGRVVWADWLAHPNGSKPESVNAELLDAAKSVLSNLEKLHSHPADKDGFRGWENGFGESAGDVLQDSIDALKLVVSESAIETPAKVSPCAGHAVQQDANETIGLAQALEQHRARKIVDAVSALPVGGKHEDSPSPFHAGYQLACDEVMHRLLTEEWDGCLTPPGKQEADEAGGAA